MPAPGTIVSWALHLQDKSTAVYMDSHTGRPAAIPLGSVSTLPSACTGTLVCICRVSGMGSAVRAHEGKHALLCCMLHRSCSEPLQPRSPSACMQCHDARGQWPVALRTLQG